ncbi:uncharacterized protein JCM15063_001649 [Sporobolomyces koalae]|uniref:uncharacterized protein n=1 Tax=Sporobolomyces koalae TaxID=500713 RepID=UPI0031747B71
MVSTTSNITATNASTTLTLPATSLDGPAGDDEPGSTTCLTRTAALLSRSPLVYHAVVLVLALYLLPTATAAATATAGASVTQMVATASEPVSAFGWTSLLKRASADAAAATCACSSSEGGDKHDAGFIVKACMIPLLVVLSGATAGLTLGLMSLDTTQLQVLIKSGSPQQQVWAAKVLPLRKNGHLLLITLLIANMIFNEVLPVLAESVMGGGIQAVIASTAMIVVFSEVIPQSVCSRFGLRIGAAMVIPVRILIYTLFVIAYPIAKLLEWILGAHDGIVYRRAELKELVALHAESAGRHGDLATDTVAIVGATLDLQSKCVRDAMTPAERMFSLPITATLDYKTLGTILEAGHSRIPVYEEIPIESNGEKRTRKAILGVLLTKQLILLDPEDAVPLRDIPINPLPNVPEDLALLNILNTFQTGRSHMAVVCRRKFSPVSEPSPLETIPSVGTTSESDLERGEASKNGSTEGFFHHLFRRNRSSSAASQMSSANGEKKAEGQGEKQSLSNLNLAELDEEFPVGIITLEDVLEELIGEEILDETDQDESHLPSMMHYIPPEARGKVGNLSGPPVAPSAHIAQQAKQKSGPKKGGIGIVNAVGRISMGRSRSAPGQPRRSGDKSATSSGASTPKEEGAGVGTNKFMGDGTPVTGSNGGGLSGVFGPFGGGGGGKKRSQSPSRANTPSTPRAVDNAPAAETPAITDQPQVEEPQSLEPIDETVPVKANSTPAPVPPVHRASSVLHAPLPSPSLLSDAVLLERGRRMMIASRSQPVSRSHTPVSTSANNAGPSSSHPSSSLIGADRSESGTRPKGGAFKSPATQLSALPQASKVAKEKQKAVESKETTAAAAEDAKGDEQ